MTMIPTHLRNILLQDATITSYTSDRIYDREIRGAGPDAAGITSTTGETLTHVILDDAGGGRAPFGPPAAYQDRINIWIIAANSATGRGEIETLAARLIVLLQRWEEPNSGAHLFYADRSGFVPDPLPATGAQERLTFNVAGVFIGVAS